MRRERFYTRIERRDLNDLLGSEKDFRKLPLAPVYLGKKTLIYVSPFTKALGGGDLLGGEPSNVTSLTIYRLDGAPEIDDLLEFLEASEYRSRSKFNKDKHFHISDSL